MITAQTLKKHHFFSAFQDSAVGMALLDLSGRWLDANTSICNILNYEKEELLKLSFQDITHPDDLEKDLDLVGRLVDGQIPSYKLEKRYVRKNGSIAWGLLTVSLAKDECGHPSFFISQIIDISKQKFAEAEQERFFELSPDLLAVADSAGFLTLVSPAWTDLLGWTRDELTSKPFIDFVHVDDVSRTVAEAESLYRGVATMGFRNRYMHRDGSFRWIEWNTRIVANDRFYCSARDVTSQVTLESLHQRKIDALDIVSSSLALKVEDHSKDLPNQIHLAGQLFENSPDCVKIVGADGSLVAMNKNGQCAMEIDDCDVLLGEKWISFWPEEAHALIEKALAGARGGIVGRFEAFCPTAKGTPKWWDVMVSPIRNMQGVVDNFLSVSRDITSARKAKEELTKYVAQMEQLNMSVPAVIFQWYARTNGERGFQYISKRYEELFGYEMLPVLESWLKFNLHPRDRLKLIRSINEAVRKKDTWTAEGRLILKDKSIKWIKFSASPTEVSTDEVIYTGVMLDVTEEKATAELKRAQEEKIRLLIENATDAFIGMNEKGIITEWNRQAEKTLGWTSDEAIGSVMSELIIPPSYKQAHLSGMHAFLKSGTAKIINKRIEVIVRNKFGHELPVEMTVGHVRYDGHSYFHAFLHDISVRKEVQRKLEEKQELLDAVLDNIDVAVVACSSTGSLTLFNNAARELHGSDVASLEKGEWAERYGLYASDGITPLAADEIPLAKAFNGQEVHNAEMVIALPNRKPRFLLASGRRLKSSNGESLGAVIALKDVTELKESEKRLIRNEQRLRAVTENVPAMIGHIDRNERILFLNTAAANMVFEKDHRTLIGKPLFEAYGQMRYDQMKPYVDRVLANEKVVVERTIVIDGLQRHYHTTYVPDVDDLGEVSGFYALAMDITERKNSELRQAESEDRLRTITDNLPVLIAYIDHNEIYRFANGTYQTWFGMAPSEIVGKTVEQVIGSEAYEFGKINLQRNLQGETVRFEAESLVEGVTRTVEVVGIPEFKNGRVNGVYVLTTDITEAKSHEKQLQTLARSDVLTGLPNRRKYEEKLQEAALRSVRSGNVLALMYLDLDKFKLINDSLGHAGGDEVLKEFATRLRLCVRSTDTVSRLAGDEFTIILEGLKDPLESKNVAEKIIHAMKEPFMIQGTLKTVSTSIGIAFMRSEKVNLDAISEQADQALYKAKQAGRNRYFIIGEP